MSNLSKFFIVVNFILAIAFMIASLTLFAKKVRWVENSRTHAEKRNEHALAKKKAEEELNRVKQSTNDTIARLETENQALTKDIEMAQGQILQLRTTNEELVNQLTPIKSNIEGLDATLQKAEARNAELEATNAQLREERNQAVLARDFAEKQAIEAVADLKEAEAELLALSKKNHSLVDRIMMQDALLEKARKLGFAAEQMMGNIVSGPPVNAKVLQVEEAVGIVILNVGKGKVKPGMEFILSRGDKYIGKVRVRNIYDDMCSALMIRELMKEPVQIADTAQTDI